mmetsp:Transcript_215/g.293  ORF Transcript_215/g.293 Transcript_215/m.293 type:complete len:703 (+) Transcript_215:62-2170(+)
MANKNSRSNAPSVIKANKTKLNKLINAIDVEDFQENDTFDVVYYGNESKTSWKSQLAFCGSNAFNQVTGGASVIADTNNSSGVADLFYPFLTPFRLAVSSQIEVPTKITTGKKTTTNKAVTSTASVSREPSSESAVLVCCGSNTTCVVAASDNDDSHLLYTWGAGIGKASAPNSCVPVLLPARCSVAALSCGQRHAALLSTDGKLFSWGAGDNGMLGHGSRTAAASPRLVEGLAALFVSSVSCGAFHTAAIASPGRQEVDDEGLVGGSLFVWGLGKAGQLGLDSLPTSGSLAGMAVRPTVVPFFEREGGPRPVRVSCGFHHTLVLARASGAAANAVFAFGWGEQGRLGLGSEERSWVPLQVPLPPDFSGTAISAGEQHSLCAGRGGCYSWGSNSNGQLGVSSPQLTEFALLPMKIPLPEGMTVKAICAGGRHSAAITHCHKLLTWGWGEEGQLGHGGETSCYLPRPVRIPRVGGASCRPVQLSLGMSHTAVLLQNLDYVKPPPVPREEPPPKTPVAEEEDESEPEPDYTASMPPPQAAKPPALCDEPDEFIEPFSAVRGVKELLQLRKEDSEKFLLPDLEVEDDQEELSAHGNTFQSVLITAEDFVDEAGHNFRSVASVPRAVYDYDFREELDEDADRDTSSPELGDVLQDEWKGAIDSPANDSQMAPDEAKPSKSKTSNAPIKDHNPSKRANDRGKPRQKT